MPDDDLRADVEAFIDAYQGKRFGSEMQRVADRILRRRDRAPLVD